MPVVRGGGRGNLHLGDPAISLLFISAPAASSAGHSELPITPQQPKHLKKQKKKNRMNKKFQLQACDKWRNRSWRRRLGRFVQVIDC